MVPGLTSSLGVHAAAVANRIAALRQGSLLERIHRGDHTVWKPDPREISNRLGWLTIAARLRPEVPDLLEFARETAAAGFTHALLLGMGGSSLAPEVFRNAFGVAPGFLDLAVLDSTDPAAVRAAVDRAEIARTLFIVSTKSGGTEETLSFFKYCFNRARQAVGSDQAGTQFVAITDPGSKLERLAAEFGFRRTFLNDPEIGGRYSALSYFGLVPAALLGMDLERLLAATAAEGDERALALGAALGELALAGRDKLTLFPAPAVAGFGDWAEQLVAESLGKEGRGILPVVGEPLGAPESYGNDRVFVALGQPDGETTSLLERLEAAGHPVLRLQLGAPHDLGAQFYLWELATAVAGTVLGVNPFDQPDVESAKVRAREMMQAYRDQGTLPRLPVTIEDGNLSVLGEAPGSALPEAVTGFLEAGAADSYLSLQAYVPMNPATVTLLRSLQGLLRDRTGRAVTLGFGPRFLHSTGQLHKGDAGNGRFLQLTCDDPADLPIPDAPGADASAATFGTLKAAQSLGDRQALLDAGRPVLRVHLSGDLGAGLEHLAKVVRG